MKKNSYKIIISALFVFIGLTFLIVITKLPQDAISYNPDQGKVVTKITWGEIGRIVGDSYKSLFKGSLGINSKGNLIWKEIKSSLKNTIILVIFTLIISPVVGVLLGVYDSKKTKTSDNMGRVMWKTVYRSSPQPLIVLLIYLVVFKIFKFKAIIPEETTKLSFKYYIVPVISLSILPIMYVSKITSKNITSTYDSEYLISAQIKGASNLRILNNHLLKNVLVDIIKDFSSLMVLILTNLVIVEYLFYYPGVTYKLIESYINSDMNTVFGITVILGLMYVIFNLIFKIIVRIIDPIIDDSILTEVNER